MNDSPGKVTKTVNLPDDTLVDDLMRIVRECEHQPRSMADALQPAAHVKPGTILPAATIVFDEDLLMQKLVIYISARDSRVFDHAHSLGKSKQ